MGQRRAMSLPRLRTDRKEIMSEKEKNYMQWSPEVSKVVLNRLVRSGTLTEKTLREAVKDEIAETERKLTDLRGIATPVQAVPRQQKRKTSSGDDETKMSQRIQGRYISLLKQMKPRMKKRMAILQKEQGREAAIKAMAALLER